ncbi:MAG: B12-binding domain-containing radical SAM protein [Desulfomonile tiedjei]|uniref:B12-binding domain-containing radical SAM protein n=1 Tax=Desulfomonile tiedjei TaxID=2358 RepID=A0A9D6Z3M1_9BACT|nr:B12-binding domain-containing radical SAM protein [Desulfomonile tiedjei]
MRVLLVNPGYGQTFWSMNTVLSMLNKKILAPPLGLLTVAALLPCDWDLKLVELTARQISEDEWDKCDVVFVGGMVVQYSGIIDSIREGKKRGKQVVVGGPWVYHFPQIAVDAGADIVVKGEAEPVIPRLLEALSRRESGIVIEADEKPSLDESPMPRYDLLDMDLYVEMDVQFSRGCPFQCDFCDITLMYGRRVRTKQPSQILAELQILYDLGWRRFVFIVDDNFIGNPSRAKKLLRELIPWMEEKGYPFDFASQASVNLAGDAELLNLMVKAGFYRVFLGIESPDRESLVSAGKHQNAAVNLDQVCQKITKAGLQIIAGCIMGFDNERTGADKPLIDFAVRNSIPEMFITLLQVGPGTELYDRMAKEGRLMASLLNDNLSSQTGLINFLPTRPVREIAEEFIRLYGTLYDPGPFLDRLYAHFSRMDPPSFRKRFLPPYPSEVRAVLITMFRQGLLYPSRLKFWKYLILGLVKFPKRIQHFFTACIMAEHYFNYRRTIQTELQAQLDILEPIFRTAAEERRMKLLESRTIAGG